MKHVVKLNESYCVFKTYEIGDVQFSRVIFETEDLKLAMKMATEELSTGGCASMPVNNIGQGHIAGWDIGMVTKKKKRRKNGNRSNSKSGRNS